MPNMPSLPNTSARRNTARLMLFVWLFALASGLANACLLQARGIGDPAPTLSNPSATGTTPEMAGVYSEGLTHDNGAADTAFAKESCLKACNEGSQTLLKHASSVDLTNPGLTPFVAAVWAAEVHVASAPGRAHDFRLRQRGSPIRVLFSRLAL